MKKHLVFLFVLLVSSLAIQAQTHQDSIIFKTTTYDYGTIVEGGDGSCEFVFTNQGTTPLLLTNVHASCGCTAPEWPKAPISPGQTGVVKVKYNTAILGAFRKTITVNSTASNAMVVLNISGNVTPKL